MICKKITVTFFLFLVYFSLAAQSPEKRGFIGVSLGPSFLIGYESGEKNAGTGLNITFINFGYVFRKGLGVSASWTGAAHIFRSNIYSYDDQGTVSTVPVKGEVSYGTLMIGPMYAVKLSDNSFLDIKAKCGRFFVGEKFSSNTFNTTRETISIGYSFTVAYRMQFASSWCMILSADYCSGKKQGIFSDERLTPLNLNAGIGFRI